ncbi:MAG: ZIP family metal transporter [Ruminococcus sp.]|nr:ZIP family metal transporter [Ruminococcus sp.]
MHTVLLSLAATGFTFLMTALGAAMVFFMRRGSSGEAVQRIFLGFAAGVMIAASVWSLLIPSIELAGERGLTAWLPAAAGLIAGVLFLMLFDRLMPFFRPAEEGSLRRGLGKTALLVFAVTLHNIPEGMAVGLAFALTGSSGTAEAMAAAIALAVGIGIQNFPEGAAISLPLRQTGMSRGKAFLCGALSGIVEPIAGVLTVLAAGHIAALMPWLLAFAAGAMLYVVVEELIPEAHLGAGHLGTMGVMLGFIIMMILDVSLG